MANFIITKTTTVGELKKQFADQIGGTLRVYDGRSQATDEVTLVSLGAKSGELPCRTSRTVGKFEEAFREELNVRVKVFTIDDWVQVLSGVTLESVAKIKRQARKADMAPLVAYRREGANTSTPNNSTATKQLEQYRGIPIIEIKYRDFYGRTWKKELRDIDEDNFASYPAIGMMYYNYGDNCVVIVDQTIGEVANAIIEFSDENELDEGGLDGIYLAAEVNGYGVDVEELGGVIGCALNEICDGGNKHSFAYLWDDWFSDKAIFIDDWGHCRMVSSDGNIEDLDLSSEQIEVLKQQLADDE